MCLGWNFFENLCSVLSLAHRDPDDQSCALAVAILALMVRTSFHYHSVCNVVIRDRLLVSGRMLRGGNSLQLTCTNARTHAHTHKWWWWVPIRDNEVGDRVWAEKPDGLLTEQELDDSVIWMKTRKNSYQLVEVRLCEERTRDCACVPRQSWEKVV